jgi:hypothetical protein
MLAPSWFARASRSPNKPKFGVAVEIWEVVYPTSKAISIAIILVIHAIDGSGHVDTGRSIVSFQGDSMSASVLVSQ